MGLISEDSLIAEYHAQITRIVEHGFLQEYDAIIVFSKEDSDALKAIGVNKTILISPYTFPLDINPVDSQELAQEDWKKELVLIGSGAHGPNEKGLEWFLNDVYPRLDENQLKQGKPPLLVVGSWSLEQRQEYQTDGINFIGFVDDLSTTIKGRVCICPIQIGTGLRTKLLASAICASPIVTTSLGCQGIGMKHEVPCLIADSALDFAAKITRLLNNMDILAPKLTDNANILVKTNFSQEAVSKQRIDLYEALAGKRS